MDVVPLYTTLVDSARGQLASRLEPSQPAIWPVLWNQTVAEETDDAAQNATAARKQDRLADFMMGLRTIAPEAPDRCTMERVLYQGCASQQGEFRVTQNSGIDF